MPKESKGAQLNSKKQIHLGNRSIFVYKWWLSFDYFLELSSVRC